MADSQIRILVFSDLDGTLLNHHDYSYRDAVPALERLRTLRIPLILVSSKTFAEIETLHSQLALDTPFVCENGSIVAAPVACEKLLAGLNGRLTKQAGSVLCYLGGSRDHILDILRSLHKHFRFRGFSQMTDVEIADCTGLDTARAVLANRRMATEPIVWQDDIDKLDVFVREVEVLGLRVVKGGRFYHIMGRVDKADAVTALTRAYAGLYCSGINSIVLGDSENDRAMLQAATIAVVIPGPDGSHMQLEHNSIFHAPAPGAAGWAYAVNSILDRQNDLTQVGYE